MDKVSRLSLNTKKHMELQFLEEYAWTIKKIVDSGKHKIERAETEVEFDIVSETLRYRIAEMNKKIFGY